MGEQRRCGTRVRPIRAVSVVQRDATHAQSISPWSRSAARCTGALRVDDSTTRFAVPRTRASVRGPLLRRTG